MILSVRVDNFLVYSNPVELSLEADMRIKKFADNVYLDGGFSALKSACIYGANNSGKTCLIRAINSIKNVLLGITAEVPCNLYREGDRICSLGVTFICESRVFCYDFKYDSSTINGYKKGFVFECLKELTADKYKNISEKELFIRDSEKGVYRFNGDLKLSEALSIVSSDNILMYTINTVKYPILEEYKRILRGFASNIEVLDMNNIPIAKTISVLKNNEAIKAKTVELIKFADLDIEDYIYNDDIKSAKVGALNEEEPPKPQAAALKAAVSIEDMLKLTSVHRGKRVQSLSYDSIGTQKVVAVASYIVDALENGKTLVVDELDSSLHFKMTRAIVALFNNELNKKAQLIFTAHDATLLDCKKLFRKDQIWFASKDKENEYLYSLADFTAKEDKIRSETDLFDRYNSGVFGAVPEPDLISILINEEYGEEEAKNE